MRPTHIYHRDWGIVANKRWLAQSTYSLSLVYLECFMPLRTNENGRRAARPGSQDTAGQNPARHEER